jgi:hypothetical protein
MDEKLKAEVEAAIAAALKPITEAVAPLATSVSELAKNHKIFADTYAADQKKLEEAAKAAADAAKVDAGKPGDKKDAPAALTAEAVSKLVADAIAADRKAQSQTAEQRAAKDAFIADPKNGLTKYPALYKQQLGDDPAKWPEQAKSIVATYEADFKAGGGSVPDVGGANREGGNPASGAGSGTPAVNPLVANGALTEGLAKFAAGIKMPAA